MDKQRQDFEEWQAQNGANADAWAVWQASRAAISVELPPIDVWAEITNRVACARNEVIDECKNSLKSAGITVI